MIAYWRPTFKCLYTISEISGNISNLEIISKRIFPPRKFKGQEDQYVFLGNYIGYNSYSYEVIEYLIDLKSRYPDRITFIKGQSEDILLKCLKGDSALEYFRMNGGVQTIASYANKFKYNINVDEITVSRIKDIIPKHHIEFLQSLETYKVIDNCVFSFGLPNTSKQLEDNFTSDFIWGTKTNQSINDYLYVTSIDKSKTIVKDNVVYMSEGKNSTILLDINSMKSMMVKNTKSKMYTHDVIYL